MLQQAQQQLLQEIRNYTPFNADDKKEQKRFINFLENNINVYSRENLTAHLTASSWITNPSNTKTLLIHHNIFNIRAPLGGHADNNPDLAAMALEETLEES